MDGSSDEDIDFNLKVNKDFEKNYNNYRRKEELQKLKDRYGDDAELSESSESSSDDSDVSDALDPNFFNTLAAIKRNDPKIYDKEQKFYDDSESTDDDDEEEAASSSKKKPMRLADFERKVILERGGKYEDDDEKKEKAVSLSEELDQLKSDFLQAAGSDDDDEDDLLVKKDNNDDDVSKADEVMEKLDGYWQDEKKLEHKDKFLRDYFLQEKFKVDEDDLDDSDLEDVDDVDHEEQYETKYNHRYEEPDKEFIKSYPRKITQSVRNVENKKKNKRAEKRKIKEEAKRKKQEELKRLKALKREEILSKLEKLKSATGKDEMVFNEDDIDEEFDPSKHDERMNQLFNNEYYDEDADQEKPVFSDLDDDLLPDQPDWDNYTPAAGGAADCEDPNFVMDCDYEANKSKKKMRVAPENTGRKRKKKSAFYESVASQKPVFDPEEKTFEEYADEYYALDCEDFAAGQAFRFKYRQTPANDFGFSNEEMMYSDNRTLNAWCSIKRVVGCRTEEEEEKLRQRYQKKARYGKTKHFQTYQPPKVAKKKKDADGAGTSSAKDGKKKVKKTNAKKRKAGNNQSPTKKQKSKKMKKENNNVTEEVGGLSKDRLAAYGL